MKTTKETFTNKFGKTYTREELERENKMLCKLTNMNPASYWDMTLEQLYICNDNLMKKI